MEGKWKRMRTFKKVVANAKSKGLSDSLTDSMSACVRVCACVYACEVKVPAAEPLYSYKSE